MKDLEVHSAKILLEVDGVSHRALDFRGIARFSCNVLVLCNLDVLEDSVILERGGVQSFLSNE